ncbi:MAG: hypothetical protein AAFU54_04310 [Chloroflexota bacterium]
MSDNPSVDIDHIATVDGVRDGQVMCTIRANARRTGLAGALCQFETDMQIILGRFGTIDLTNPMHDDRAFKGIIMAHGELPYFSGAADIEEAKIDIIACLDKDNKSLAPMRANPASGTPITPVSPENMEFFRRETEYHMYTGTSPEDDAVDISVITREYSRDVQGWGEALHRAYFGQNGSGKTVFALTHLAGRLVMNPNMGCIIPDTAGDISQPGKHTGGPSGYSFDFHGMLERGGRTYDLYTMEDLYLTETYAFEDVLANYLAKTIRLGQLPNVEPLVQRVVATHVTKQDMKLQDVEFDALISALASDAPNYWNKATGKQKEQKLQDLVGDETEKKRFHNEVMSFFLGRMSLKQVVEGVLKQSKIIILDLMGLSERHKELVMAELFRQIQKRSAQQFKGNDSLLVNAEVVLDEAPRWIPQGSKSDVSAMITDAVKNTRKYGLSWTFIGQSMADIDNAVMRQSHTKWFGKNLGVGSDRGHLETHLGKSGLQMYESLALRGGFYFVGVGREVNLGANERPVAVMSYSGDASATIIAKNLHIWR